jgi:hypothetical protein
MIKILAAVTTAVLLTAGVAQAHPWGGGGPGWGGPGWGGPWHHGWHHGWHGGYGGGWYGVPYVEDPDPCAQVRVWRHHHWVIVCAED